MEMTRDEMLDFWAEQSDVIDRLNAGEVLDRANVCRSFYDFWDEFSECSGSWQYSNYAPSAKQIDSYLSGSGFSGCEFSRNVYYIFKAQPSDEWLKNRPIPKMYSYWYDAVFSDEIYAHCDNHQVIIMAHGKKVGVWPDVSVSEIPQLQKAVLQYDIQQERIRRGAAEALAEERARHIDDLRRLLPADHAIDNSVPI